MVLRQNGQFSKVLKSTPFKCMISISTRQFDPILCLCFIVITAFCAAKDMFISTELQVHWWGSEVCECYCDILALCYGVLGHLLKSISSYQLNNWQLDRYAASFLYILLSMSYETLSKPALIMIIKHVYAIFVWCTTSNFTGTWFTSS